MAMAEAAAPWALLCRQGRLLLNPGPASLFLRSNPQGAYTTTRTGDDGSQLLLWERHMRRLAQSMELLATAMPDRFPDPPRSFDGLLSLIEPSLQVGLQRALEMQRSGEELNVTVLASAAHRLDVKPQPLWEMSVHLSNYAPNPTSTAAHVAVMGLGRDLPLAKYSLWASTRQALENAKPPGVSEILLSNDGDGLLEGSVTNFFVVATAPGAPDPGTPEKWRHVEVQTAALADGVLPGVIRQLVIQVCGDEGIPLREVAPSWGSRGAWREAFVTSSLRIVQPVGSIRRPKPWVWGNDDHESLNTCAWTELRFESCGPVTEHIQKLVLRCALGESVPVHQFLN